MFEIKGKYLTSRYYARKIPVISGRVYEMSRVEKSSIFFKTVPFPTRVIALKGDFSEGYSKSLRKYLRRSDLYDFEIRRPDFIPDLEEVYRSVAAANGLPPLHENMLKKDDYYFYSEIHHPRLGRLAAHLSIGDREENTVFGFVNASVFRTFRDKESRRICSIANKYLFHADMVYFQELGYHFYDMVGTAEPMNQMKKEFGGEIVMTYTHIPRPVVWLKKWRVGRGRRSG